MLQKSMMYDGITRASEQTYIRVMLESPQTREKRMMQVTTSLFTRAVKTRGFFAFLGRFKRRKTIFGTIAAYIAQSVGIKHMPNDIRGSAAFAAREAKLLFIQSL
jgi:hypothetical protein